ncbi:MAG: hypothetical protein JSR58_01920 [Verrucomicrobia bacterium]|nr:hypothetical protein [Verrucomicrobiota bacterium]
MISQSIFTSKRFWAMIVIILFAVWFNQRPSLNFSLSRISAELPYRAEWEVESSSFDMDSIFSQEFHYLASGSQSYAFESADGKYVIKFFKMKHLLWNFWDHFRPGVVERRTRNLDSIFGAYKLCYDHLREETGLVFLHLNSTQNLHRTITISDRLHRRHEVDLDRYAFLVQEKAELVFTRMDRLRKKGDIQGVLKARDAICDLVQKRIAKGFADRDKAVSHNFGFIGDRPVQFDIGRLYKGVKQGEYERIRHRLESWMQENGVTTETTSSAAQ